METCPALKRFYTELNEWDFKYTDQIITLFYALAVKHCQEVMIPQAEKEAVRLERERIKQILKDWDEFTEADCEEKWQEKYGCDTTELVNVIKESLEGK